MSPSLRPLPRSALTALVTFLLALHAWMAVSASLGKSFTFDEVGHLTGGFSYWHNNDYRLHPENGNLPQRWATLPLVAAGASMPVTNQEAWHQSDVWTIGDQFLFRSGNNTEFLLACARSMMVLFSVGTGLLIFLWALRLWGDHGALLSHSLFIFCPNFLAHGALVTSDVPMTFFFMATTTVWWWHLQRPSWKSWTVSAMTLGLACLAKFSFLLLAPMFGLLAIWQFLAADDKNGGKRISIPLLLLSISGHIAVAWFMIWMAFGFRYTAFAPGLPEGLRFYAPWEQILPEKGPMAWFFSVTRTLHLFPEAFLQGFAFVLSASKQRGAFLNGEFSIHGWVWFFPYAFLVKTPLAQLIAYVLATVMGLERAHTLGSSFKSRFVIFLTGLRRAAPLVVVFIVYWAVSLTTGLNIGHRHILPTYPALFVLAGAAIAWSSLRWRAWIASGLIIGAAISSFAIRPDYLAYFNNFAGGPENAHRHLVDSSLDWGQDLPGLADWISQNRRPSEMVYLSYFGSAPFSYYGIPARELSPYPLVVKPYFWHVLQPGLYCLSATMLQDVYSPWRGAWTLETENLYRQTQDQVKSPPANAEETRMRPSVLWKLDRLRFARLCQYLRVRRPETMIGYSIFIYRLSPRELHDATQGSLNDLGEIMAKAQQAPAVK